MTNTGDGYLMAAEAGAELSGMEFTVAPAHSNMTPSMAYAYATYYDADGRELETPSYGQAQTLFLARTMSRGPVFCSLHRLPEDIKTRLHKISPNVPIVFDRWGVDPYRDKFQVTMHTDGSIRGLGGVRVLSTCGETTVPGLYAAGDDASREKAAGAISGGGAVNSAWALASGVLAGRAAAKSAGSRRDGRLQPLGRVGLRPAASSRTTDLSGARDVVRREMQSFDRALFRNADGLVESALALADAWRELADHAGAGDLPTRETAALLAAARWSTAAATARAETRGMHLRLTHQRPTPRSRIGRSCAASTRSTSRRLRGNRN